MSENSNLIWIGAVLLVVIGSIVWFLRGRSGGTQITPSTKPVTPPSEPFISNPPASAPSPVAPEPMPIERGVSEIQPNEATTRAEAEPSTSTGRKKAPTRKKAVAPKKTGKTASAKTPRTAKKK